MLSISQSSNFFHCLEWVPSESGVEVVNFNKISIENPLSSKDSIKEILDKFNPITKDESNSISISLDISNVQISSINFDPKIDLHSYVKWYEENILGKYIVENFDIYYYPCFNNNLIIVMIDKIFRSNLIKSVYAAGCNLIDLNIGIFSANYAITQILKLNNLRNHLLWKIDKNNIHYITYYEKNILSNFVKFKKNKNKINFLNSLGDSKNLDKIIKYFSEKNNSNFIDKIFIYQLGNSTVKKNDEKILHNNVEFLDISDFFKIKNNKFNFSGYIENSNSLKGVDV